jgi:hypothetical protein
MCCNKALGIAMIALSATLASPSSARSGSYTWAGSGGDGEFYYYPDSNGNLIRYDIPPPGPLTVSIDYDVPQGYSSSTTSGDMSTFQQVPFVTAYIQATGPSLWVGFGAGEPDVTITAPPPGGGPDTIVFQFNDTFTPGFIAIYAPNGTLSTSTQLPATLTAFEHYGFNNADAGFFEFNLQFPDSGLQIFGSAIGSLGVVPEPPTGALLATSAAFGAALAVFRRWKLARSRRNPPSRLT